MVIIGSSTLPKIIGERINPTARKKLAEDMKEGSFALVQAEAQAQQEAGAHLLDINIGAPGINGSGNHGLNHKPFTAEYFNPFGY